MKMNLENKVAIVIASSQGLGKAVAVQLAKEGVSVMLTARNEENLKKVKEEIGGLGAGKAEYVVADITKPSDIQRVVAETIEKFGQIDILINNAGGPPSGKFEDLKEEDWVNAFELNLLSYVRIIQEVLPHLKKSGGDIINIASTSVKEPIPGLILSNVFRLGIVGLTKTLSRELAEYNILVNTVAPGRISTSRIEYLDRSTAEKENLSYEEVVEGAKKSIPLKRLGTPEEFANVVTFLVSGGNTYMTGSTFAVDGGAIKSI